MELGVGVRRMVVNALVIVALAASTIVMPTVAAASERSASAGRTIKISGKSFAFVPSTITIRAGERVTIVYRSIDVFHDLVVKGAGRIVKANGGKTRRGTLMIGKPGTYKFWCSVRGHRSAGMEGTIIVQ